MWGASRRDGASLIGLVMVVCGLVSCVRRSCIHRAEASTYLPSPCLCRYLCSAVGFAICLMSSHSWRQFSLAVCDAAHGSDGIGTHLVSNSNFKLFANPAVQPFMKKLLIFICYNRLDFCVIDACLLLTSKYLE